jgi:hypothetical protein
VSNDMANVLSFVDTYANWNALFAFVCVTFAIVGALHNRRTNKVKVEKSKVFIPAAIIAILVVGAGIIFVFISTFANFGMSLNDFLRHKDSPDYQFNLIGSIVTVVMLFSFLGVTIIATFVRGRHDVHKPHLKHH